MYSNILDSKINNCYFSLVGFIYKITSPTDKIYVGQTTNLFNRISKYKTARTPNQVLLHRSLKKYGWENHKFEIIECCPDSILNEREVYWILYYDCNAYNNPDRGLNLTNGGMGASGRKNNKNITGNTNRRWSKETREKFIKNRTGKGRKIYQYDLNGEFIREWITITEASNKLKLNKGAIVNCCKQKEGFSKVGQFIFRYEKFDKLELKQEINIKKSQKPILQIKDNNIIKIWKNSKEIEEILNYTRSAIRRSIELNKIYKNCNWEYF